MADSDPYNPKSLSVLQHTFLQVFRRGRGRIGESARLAGVGYCTVLKWRKESDTFAKAFELCHAEAKGRLCEELETEAFRRAHDGVAEPIFYLGKKVGEVKRYSDSLMGQMLKAKIPDYRDRMEMSGHLALGQMSDEDLRNEVQALVAGGFLAPHAGQIDAGDANGEQVRGEPHPDDSDALQGQDSDAPGSTIDSLF